MLARCSLATLPVAAATHRDHRQGASRREQLLPRPSPLCSFKAVFPRPTPHSVKAQAADCGVPVAHSMPRALLKRSETYPAERRVSER